MVDVEIQRYDYKEGLKFSIPATEWVEPTTSDTWSLSYWAFVRAAMLVGRQSMFDVYAFGHWSKLELRWRAAMMRANLTTADIGKAKVRRLVPSAAFKALDGSEKTAVSYLLGIATAKIVAEKEHDVRWLMHLDVYSKPCNPYKSKAYKVANVPGPRDRPDLIGLTPNNKWAVVEAKGRTQSADDVLRLKSKRQTRKISTINGDSPTQRFASIAQLMKRGLKIDIVDPTDPLEDAFALHIEPDLFMHLAYRTVFDILNAGARRTLNVKTLEFVVVDFPEADMSIGLKSDIFKALSEPVPTTRPPEGGFSFIREMANTIIASVADIPEGGLDSDGDEENGFQAFSIGADGTLMGFGKSWRPGGEINPKPPLAPFGNLIDIEYKTRLTERVDIPPGSVWRGDLFQHISLERKPLLIAPKKLCDP